MSSDLRSRQDGGGEAPFIVTIDCSLGNEYDGRFAIRISAIFVIFIGSMFGCVVPLLLFRSSTSKSFTRRCFFAARFFGSGVIVATALIHLFAPAVAALYSPCLNPESAITQYAWPEGICLMAIFAMLFAELLASHYAVKADKRAAVQQAHGPDSNKHVTRTDSGGIIRSTDHETVPGDTFALQMTSLFILEFGIIFHSILIGLTLAVAGEEFIVLYIVLTFHQTFEGVGLGARLALISWPRGRAWMPYVLSAAYSLSTPIAIGVGLSVRQTFEPGSHLALVVSGVFDSISAGILLYTGLVQLIAYDFFMNGSAMMHATIGRKLGAFGWMCLGAGLMSLLGNWA
ncbi:Zinc/iron permease [Emericellopsis atlantica]|uniref:Zinc/iron permease n=1 Tax=Emericellopsis atlantica TaxID=2614577 RepID=A0A9P7ZDA8_9HYPO|nr:Zinc/iron permease [Emericellopsis atlantica]KAG9249697.1 Zinc/iron permease [Emericellopsis atlantica]